MSQAGFTPIKLYHSTTAAAAPSAGNLEAGELALNTTDEKLYFKNTAGVVKEIASTAGSGGTVSSVSVVSANGMAGTVANATTTPAITLSTSVTGVLKGNGTAISAAVAGTDYQAPLVSGTNIKTINGNSVLGSGDLSISGGLDVANYTNQSANVTLTSSDANKALTFTLANDITVTMPDATTLTGSRLFVFKNNSTAFGIAIYNNSGTYLFTLPPSTGNTVWASSIATSAGEWTAQEQIYDYLSGPTLGPTANGYGVSSSKEAITALSTSSFIQMYVSNSNAMYAVVGTYSGGSVTYGTPTLVSGYAGQAVVCAFDATSGVIAYTDNVYGVYLRTFSISGTTITLGDTFSTAPTYSDGFISITAVTSSTFAVSIQSTTNIDVQVFSVSGSVISADTTLTNLVTNGNGYQHVLTTLTSSVLILAYIDSASNPVAMYITYSGGTLTATTSNTDTTTNASTLGLTALSSTSFTLVYTDNADVYARAYTASGGAISAGTKVTIASGVNSNHVDVAALSSTSLTACFDNSVSLRPAATTYTVSGTAVTASGAVTVLNTNNNSNNTYANVNVVGLQAPAIATPSASTFVAYAGLGQAAYDMVFSVSGSTITPLTTNYALPVLGNQVTVNFVNRTGVALNKTQFLHVTNIQNSNQSRYSVTVSLYNVSNTTSTFQSSVVFTGDISGANSFTICAISSTQAIAFYRAAPSSFPTVTVITRSGNTLSAGTPVTVESVGSATQFTMSMLSSTTAILTYRSSSSSTTMRSAILTVSGSSVTVGSLTNYSPTGANLNYLQVLGMSPTSALIYFATSTPEARVAGVRISGTSITYLTNSYAGVGEGTMTCADLRAISPTAALCFNQVSRSSAGANVDNYYGMFSTMVEIPAVGGGPFGTSTSLMSNWAANRNQTALMPVTLNTSATTGVVIGFSTNLAKPVFYSYVIDDGSIQTYQNSQQVLQPSTQYPYQTFGPCMIPLTEPVTGGTFSSEGVLIAYELSYIEDTNPINNVTFRKYNSKGAIK
jgi:hypothetical protein